MQYYTTSVIHLSLEDFYNRGLTPEKAKEAIESIINPFQPYMYSTADRLKCKPSYINRNWNVEVSTCNPDKIQHIADLIEDALYVALRGLK